MKTINQLAETLIHKMRMRMEEEDKDLCSFFLLEPRQLEYWFSLDGWTPDQGLAILLGIHPMLPGKGITGGNRFSLSTIEQNYFFTLDRFHWGYMPVYRSWAITLLMGPFPRKPIIICAGDVQSFMSKIADDAPFDKSEIAGVIHIPNCDTLLFDIKERLRWMYMTWTSGTHPDKPSPQYFIEWAKRKNIKIGWLEWARENGYAHLTDTITSEQNKKAETKTPFKSLRPIQKLKQAYLAAAEKKLKKNRSLNKNEMINELEKDGFKSCTEKVRHRWLSALPFNSKPGRPSKKKNTLPS